MAPPTPVPARDDAASGPSGRQMPACSTLQLAISARMTASCLRSVSSCVLGLVAGPMPGRAVGPALELSAGTGAGLAAGAATGFVVVAAVDAEGATVATATG